LRQLPVQQADGRRTIVHLGACVAHTSRGGFDKALEKLDAVLANEKKRETKERRDSEKETTAD